RRIARAVWPAVGPGRRLWLSHGPLAGPIRFAARLPAAGPGGAVADARHGPGRPHPPRPAARRPAVGRPRLLLLCPPGVVRSRRPPRPVPGAPAAAHLLPAASPPRRAGQGNARRGRLAALALAEAVGQAGSVGGVLQAEGATVVDDRGAVCRVAGVDHGPGAALPRARAGPAAAG